MPTSPRRGTPADAASSRTESKATLRVPPHPPGAGSIAFLLAQLGTHAADRFAARVAALDLIPPQAGILRAIAVEPGRSQQALSEQLGLLPSRVVAFVDDLEQRGYVERRRNTDDRRLYALHLTKRGQKLMGEMGKIGKAHEDEITQGLSAAQRTALVESLQTLAARHGLTPGVHPGYKSLGRGKNENSSAAS